MSNLLQRVMAALIALPLLLWSVWSSQPVYFSLIVLAATLLGIHEFFLLAEKIGCHPLRWVGYFGTAGVMALFYFGLHSTEWLPVVLAVILTCMMSWSVLTSKTQEDFQKVMVSHSVTLFGIAYVGFLAGFLIGVRQLQPSHRASQFLTLFFMIVMAGDTFAYFAGRAFGRHKLSPKISPGKTIEGSFGGILGSIAFALLAHVWFFPQLPLWHAIFLAIVMNIMGQVGDLFESLLKRGSGAKDAAAVIPGHGGLLDRLDSLLFNAPVLYYYAKYFGQ